MVQLRAVLKPGITQWLLWFFLPLPLVANRLDAKLHSSLDVDFRWDSCEDGVLAIPGGKHRVAANTTVPASCTRLECIGSQQCILDLGGGLTFEAPAVELRGKIRVLGNGGPGVSCEGNVTITQADLHFENCFSKFPGGGLLTLGHTVIADQARVSFTNCSSQSEGGGLVSSLGTKISDQAKVAFTNCSSQDGGGGFFSYLETKISDQARVAFTNCSSQGSGGGFWSFGDTKISDKATVTFTNCNTQGSKGSSTAYGCLESYGVTNISGNATVNFTNCTGGACIAIPPERSAELRNVVMSGTATAVYAVAAKRLVMRGVQVHGTTSAAVLADNAEQMELVDFVASDVPQAVTARGVTRFLKLSGVDAFCAPGTSPCLDVDMDPGSSAEEQEEREEGQEAKQIQCPFAEMHDLTLGLRGNTPGKLLAVTALAKCMPQALRTPIHTRCPVGFDFHKVRRERTTTRVQHKKSRNFTGCPENACCELRSASTCNTSCQCLDYWCDTCTVETKSVFLELGCQACSFGTFSFFPQKAQYLYDNGSADADDLAVPGRESSAVACQSCTRFGEVVGEAVTCEQNTLYLPNGTTCSRRSMSEGDNYSRALVRCPNRRACPGGDSAPDCHCAPGYDPDSPGCSSCAEFHGRSTSDALTCSPCSHNFAWSWIGFVIVKPVIVAFTLYSAMQASAEKERGPALVKMIFSFSTFATTAWSIAKASDAYLRAHSWFKDLIGYSLAVAEVGSGLVSFSPDCLLKTPSASMWKWIALEAAHPVALAALLTVVVSRQLLQGKTASWLRSMQVVAHSLLPSSVGRFCAWLASVHLTTELEPRILHDATLQYNLPCGLAMAFLGLAIFALLGPCLTLFALGRSAGWSEEEYDTATAFVRAGYKESNRWWELTVLMRKFALTVCLVMMPASYTPSALLAFQSIIMILSLALHMRVSPYTDVFLNQAEGFMLLSCSLAIPVVAYLHGSSWTASDGQAFAVLALLTIWFALTFGTLLLLFIYYSFDKFVGTIQRIKAFVTAISTKLFPESAA
eukprot:TRINITY_DN15233_c0_g1_i1.p1 TRINITY_DN15233_c0_g1~~TRINITY_DN15233_c0_g1_i1.p1  ORF type:complete len:1030 (+),score=154.41 TRINITY_DN15233_c0_g1_i1:102-3191(+)